MNKQHHAIPWLRTTCTFKKNNIPPHAHLITIRKRILLILKNNQKPPKTIENPWKCQCAESSNPENQPFTTTTIIIHQPPVKGIQLTQQQCIKESTTPTSHTKELIKTIHQKHKNDIQSNHRIMTDKDYLLSNPTSYTNTEYIKDYLPPQKQNFNYKTNIKEVEIDKDYLLLNSAAWTVKDYLLSQASAHHHTNTLDS
jgi:hypothetical protein